MHHLKGTCECYGGTRKRPACRRPTARGGGYFAKLQKVAGPFIRQPYLIIDESRRPPYAVQLCMEASTDRHIRARSGCSPSGGTTANQTKIGLHPGRAGHPCQDITAAMHIDHRDSGSQWCIVCLSLCGDMHAGRVSSSCQSQVQVSSATIKAWKCTHPILAFLPSESSW